MTAKTANKHKEPTVRSYHTRNQQTLFDMIESCKSAKKCIYLEQYVLENDEIGNQFIDAFIQKAKEGVDVRLLLDGWGAKKLERTLELQAMLASGVQVTFFRPFSVRWLTKGMFPRDHRKILIVDDYAYIGGVCMFENVRTWRDTMVCVQGKLQDSLVKMFENMWAITAYNETISDEQPENDDNDMSVFINSPVNDSKVYYDKLLSRIEESKKSVLLSAPYFVPDEKFLAALKRAKSRDVKIKIILSDYSKYASWAVGKYIALQLAEKGVEIFYYQPKMYHLKMMIIDGEWASIGSCNLDYLSLRRNQEAMVVGSNYAFVNELTTHFEHDLKHSKSFDADDWSTLPVRHKLAVYAFYPLRHYL